MQATLKMNLYIFKNALYALKKKWSEAAVASLGSPPGAVFGVFNRMLANTVCVFSRACIGWVAVTPQFKDTLTLRGYTPQGTVLTVRRPLLPHIVNIKGKRIKGSVAYKTKRPPALVYNLQKKR